MDDVVLEDQFRTRRSIASLAGSVAVLVYAGRAGAAAALALGRSLNLRLNPPGTTAALPIVPVVCLPEVPQPFHGLVRTAIRRQAGTVVVWIDFHGVMRRVFGMHLATANVVVLDASGAVVHTAAGAFESTALDDLVATIVALRDHGSPPGRTHADG